MTAKRIGIRRQFLLLQLLMVLCFILLPGVNACASPERKVGVVYVVHGGFTQTSQQGLWSATLQIFAYDPHSAVYKNVIWNPKMWPRILNFGNAPKERGKYAFEFARIGGTDPANTHTGARLGQLREALKARESQLGVKFIVDYAAWIASDPAHHVNPRMLYEPGVEGGSPLTYCGSVADGGIGPDRTWPDCDPQRFNIDGPIERMLKAGADEIVMIDMTTSGVRFFKSFDVVSAARAVVAQHNAVSGTDIKVHWLNDPEDLMRDSYPDQPADWTRTLGEPEHDPRIPLAGRPNPVSSDPRLAAFHVDGIEQRLRPKLALARTGVLLVNHATRTYNQLFDPKIDDTLVLNENIKRELIARHPEIKTDNIVGAWMGVKEYNPQIKPQRPNGSRFERTRRMRGENLGHAYLYETDEQLPGGEWGYRYWDALERLKNQGVEHIVVAFPQIMVDSVLNLVELPNQIAREIGYRSWLYDGQPDYATYPGTGHPFTDYWGIWVDTECRVAGQPEQTRPCCFDLGGCGDGRSYPPPRQTPVDVARNDLDPSLAWDIPAFGHLGYDPEDGPPTDDHPVSGQYRGSWAIWQPPNSRPEVAVFLADHVIEFLQH